MAITQLASSAIALGASITFPIPAGTNRCAVVSFAYSIPGAQIANMDWGGQSAQQGAESPADPGGFGGSYYILEDQIALLANNTVTPTFTSGSGAGALQITVYEGVSQTDPISLAQVETLGSPLQVTSPVQGGDAIHAVATNDAGGTLTLTPVTLIQQQIFALGGGRFLVANTLSAAANPNYLAEVTYSSPGNTGLQLVVLSAAEQASELADTAGLTDSVSHVLTVGDPLDQRPGGVVGLTDDVTFNHVRPALPGADTADWWVAYEASAAEDGAGATPAEGAEVVHLPNTAVGPSSINAAGDVGGANPGRYRADAANGEPGVQFLDNTDDASTSTGWTGADILPASTSGMTVAWVGTIYDLASHFNKWIITGPDGTNDYPEIAVRDDGTVVAFTGGNELSTDPGQIVNGEIFGVLFYLGPVGSTTSWAAFNGDVEVTGSNVVANQDMTGLMIGNRQTLNFSTTDHSMIFTGLREGEMTAQEQSDFWNYVADLQSVGTDHLADVGDVAGLSDAAGGTQTTARGPSDTSGLTDAVTYSMTVAHESTAADTADLTDSVSYVLDRAIDSTAADTVGLTDSVSYVLNRAIDSTAAENVGLTDAVSSVLVTGRNLFETVGLSDSVSHLSTTARDPNEQLGLTDDVQFTLDQGEEVADSVGLTDSATAQIVIERSVTDSIGLTDTVSYAEADSASLGENQALTDTVIRSLLSQRTVSDDVGLTDQVTYTLSVSPQVDDTADLADQVGRQADYVRPVADSAGLTDQVTYQLQSSPEIPELVGLDDEITSVSAFDRFPSSTAALTDTVLYTLTTDGSSSVADGATITDGTSWQSDAARSTADTADLSDSVTYVLDLGVVVPEDLGLTDTVTYSLSFDESVADVQGLVDDVVRTGDKARAVTDISGLTDQVLYTITSAGDAQVSDSGSITDAVTGTSDTEREPADTAGLSDSVNYMLSSAPGAAEVIGLGDDVTHTIDYQRNAFSTVGMGDLTGPFISAGGGTTDGAGISDNVSYVLTGAQNHVADAGGAGAVEPVAITDAVTYVLAGETVPGSDFVLEAWGSRHYVIAWDVGGQTTYNDWMQEHDRR